MSEIKFGQNSNGQVEENAGIGGFTGFDGKPVDQKADGIAAAADYSPFTGGFVGGFVGNQENDQPEVNQYVGGFVSNQNVGVSEVPATSKSKAIIVSEKQVVGHLSFGSQNKPMEEFFISHKETFDI